MKKQKKEVVSMTKLKRLLGLLTAVTFISAIMTACENQDDSTFSQTAEHNSSQQQLSAENSSEYFSEFDLNTDYSSVTAEITLNRNTAEINGNGVSAENNIISVTSGGTYLFSGKLDDGQIYVNSEENVHLVFNGVDITNSASSPVFVENAKNICITLAENTENILTDSENYVFASDTENEPDAVIFSKDDLSINGSGTLNVNANYNEGITTKNDLRISGGTISITSKGNGIKGKDSVVTQNATLNITAGEDGIKTSNTQESDKGYIVFESGQFEIKAENDAVQSENYLTVNSACFNIETGGGSAAAPAVTEDFSHMNKGRNGFEKHDMQMPTDENSDTAMADNFRLDGERFDKDSTAFTDEASESKKGLKSENGITINGGAVNADCYDDAIHSAADINIKGGDFSLSSGDDGIHSDSNVKIANGNIIIKNSYEGIEGIAIDIDGGFIDVIASDDGFNSSDGTGNSMSPMAVSENCSLNINNGYVYVNAGGDALDSNGSMNINGGLVLVDGPENDGNSALDSGSEININGGILIAAGSSGMLEIPSDNSKQNVLVVSFDEQKSASVPIYLTDENDSPVFSYIPSKKYSSVIISTPDISDNKEYSIYTEGTVNRSSTEINWKNYSSRPECSDGTLIEKSVISEKITQVGDGTAGQMGGGMNHGNKDGMRDGFGNFNPDDMPTPPEGMEMPENGMMPPPDNGRMQHPQGDMNPFEKSTESNAL